MTLKRIGGILMQLAGRLQERWGSLAGDPHAVANGIRAQRIGRIREQNALAKEESERQLDEFRKRNSAWWNPSGRRRTP